MPAQPPFLTPTRTPAIGRSAFAINSLMRPAAASVSRITWGLGRAVAIASSPRFGSAEASIGTIITQKYQTLR